MSPVVHADEHPAHQINPAGTADESSPLEQDSSEFDVYRARLVAWFDLHDAAAGEHLLGGRPSAVASAS